MSDYDMQNNSSEINDDEQDDEEKHHGEMSDSFMDDLYGVFDDEPEDDLIVDTDTLSLDGTSPERPSTGPGSGLTTGGDSQGSKESAKQFPHKKFKKRRQSLKVEVTERGMQPPSWHSDAADKPHRHAMVLEIARLLQARKKSQPSAEWLKQLPHKARNLEERLYRTAPSLESYLDRTTLKNRLLKLAQVITLQYKNAKQKGLKARGRGSNLSHSTASVTSFSTRDSITSQNSLDSVRSVEMASADKPIIPGFSGRQFSDALGHSLSGASAFYVPSGNLHERKAGTNDLMPTSSGVSVRSDEASSQADSMQDRGLSQTSGLSELERQKAVNETLQQQILENIRQQEELVRKLQARQNSVNFLPTAPSSTAAFPTSLIQDSLATNAIQSHVGYDSATMREMQTNNLSNMNLLLSTQNNMNSNSLMVAQVNALSNRQSQNLYMSNSQGALRAAQFNPPSLFTSNNSDNILQRPFPSAPMNQVLMPQQLHMLQNMSGGQSNIISSLNQSAMLPIGNSESVSSNYPNMPPPPRIIQRPPSDQPASQQGNSWDRFQNYQP